MTLPANSPSYPIPLTIENAYKILELTRIKYSYLRHKIVFVLNIPYTTSYPYQSIAQYCQTLFSSSHLLNIQPHQTTTHNIYTTLNDLENCFNIDKTYIICTDVNSFFCTNAKTTYFPIRHTYRLRYSSIKN